MKGASVGIIALIIFSAIMLVIIWFIFTTGIGFFMEYAIPSENVASFSTFARRMGEGWRRGSVMQSFILSEINTQDTFGMGIITKESAEYVQSMPVCFEPKQKYCIKLASKDRIDQCKKTGDLCICLFRLKYHYSYQSPPDQLMYRVGIITGDYNSDMDAIRDWNNNYFPRLVDRLERLDVLECKSFIKDLSCGNTTHPCIISSESRAQPGEEDIIVWVQAPISISTITFDRKFDSNDVPLYYMTIKTYPVVLNVYTLAPICTYPQCLYGDIYD